MAIRKEPALPSGLSQLFESMKDVYADAATGINKPEAVVRLMVLDAMKMFARLTGRSPRLLYIPRSLEAALQVDRGRNLGYHEKDHGKIREAELLFTCRPIWDADEFRVE